MIRHQIFSLILALLLSSKAHCAIEISQKTSFEAVAYVPLDRVSQNFFQSRLRLKVEVTLHKPSDISSSTETHTDDLGNTQTNTTYVLSADSLAEETLSIEEIDEEGNFLRLLEKKSSAVKSVATLAPAKYDIYASELFSFHPIQGESLTIIDKTGKRVFLTLELNLHPVFYVDAKSYDLVQTSTPALDLRLSMAYLPPGLNYSPDGPIFTLRDQAVPSSLASAKFCTRAGEWKELSPLLVGEDMKAERVEYCYPQKPFVPIVLIRNNPPHEPKEMIERVTSAALASGGKISTMPLYDLGKGRDSLANCHGYAVLATLGSKALPENAYWLQADDPASFSMGTRPFETILFTNYRLIKSVESDYYSPNAENKLSNDKILQAGDLITFTGGGGYAHSGVIRRSPDKKSWWFESKYEEGPVIFTPIASAHDVIPNLYTKIQIYRLK